MRRQVPPLLMGRVKAPLDGKEKDLVKVEVADISAVRKKIHIHVPAEVVTEEVDKAYRALKRSVKLRGFRPGKTPRHILERYYGDRVRYDVTTKLIQETYPKSLQEKSLTPVSQPDIEDVEIRAGEDFQYTAIVEVKPQVEVSDYVGIEIEKQKGVPITEEKVQGRLDEIREMFARLEDLEEDRPVQEGDFVLVEHQVLMNGEPLTDKGPQEEVLELNPDRVEEWLLKAVVGMRLGEETEAPHTFASDHPDQRVAGKEGTIKIMIKRIQKKILPDLDDSFAQRLGEYTTLEELRAKVREELEEGERQRMRSALDEAIMDELLQRHSFEVPETMVELQIQQMIQNTRRRLVAQGLTLEQAGHSEEQMRVQYRDAALKAVRTALILEGIAKQEGMEVTEEDLGEAYQKISQRTGQATEEVKKVYEDPAALDALKGNLIEEKTLDFLREKAKMKRNRAAGKEKE